MGTELPSTKQITDRLIECHRRFGWRAEREALFTPRRIDVLAIAPGAAEVIGFEVKTSIADFKSELKTPAKRAAVMAHCTQFYFAVPLRMIHPDEVPDDCGLIYFDSHWIYLVKYAPGRKVELPFEVDLREWREEDARQRKEAELAYAECMQGEYDECHGRINDEVGEHFALMHLQVPSWMRDRPRRPLHFQFDIRAVAAKMASVFLPAVELEEVPF
jgi:DNA repair protein MmcB-like